MISNRQWPDITEKAMDSDSIHSLRIIKIDATKDSPEIVLDKDNLKIQIIGPSYPEDAVEVYQQVFLWLESIDVISDVQLLCVFDFSILSSASSKLVYEIMRRIDELFSEGQEISVLWYYEEGDDDMMDVGQSFADSFNFPIEVIEKP